MNPRAFAYEASALPPELLRNVKKLLAGLAGLEPATTRLEDERSCPSELQTRSFVRAMEATEGVEPSTCCLRDSRSAGWSYVAAGNRGGKFGRGVRQAAPRFSTHPRGRVPTG